MVIVACQSYNMLAALLYFSLVLFSCPARAFLCAVGGRYRQSIKPELKKKLNEVIVTTWFTLLKESACFQEYHDALKLQRDGDLNGARALYLHLLQSSFLMGEVSETCTHIEHKLCSCRNERF